MRLLPPIQKPGRVFTDNSKECIKAGQNVQSTQDTISTHRSEISGVAEIIVARIKGTAKVMVHSSPKNGTARYVRDKMAGDKTACEKKNDSVWSQSQLRPIFWKDESRLHQAGKKMLPRLRRTQERVSLRNSNETVPAPKKIGQEEICRFHVQTGLSNSSIFFKPFATRERRRRKR